MGGVCTCIEVYTPMCMHEEAPVGYLPLSVSNPLKLSFSLNWKLGFSARLAATEFPRLLISAHNAEVRGLHSCTRVLFCASINNSLFRKSKSGYMHINTDITKYRKGEEKTNQLQT